MTSYVDVDALLVGWLQAQMPSARVAVATPADPQGTNAWATNGFIKVQRIGGTGRFGIDQARVNAECLALNYGAAAKLALQVRTLFESRLLGYQTPGAFVSEVVTTSAPTWLPYDDVNITRFVGMFTVTIHSQ